MTSRQKQLLVWALIAIPALALVLQIGLVAENWRWYQYDFRAYYTGPTLYASGQDPYSVEAHLALARELELGNQRLPFVYSPTMLMLLTPLSWLPYSVLYGLWLSVQVMALITVITLTVRVLGVPLPITLWVMTFGLNGTLAAVLRSGQMTLMVLAVLMLGVWALSRQRWQGASALITLAAIPKIWVLPLLSLVVVPLAVPRILWMLGGVVVCFAIGLSGRFLLPELQERYETIISGFVDFSSGARGPYNGTVVNMLATLEDLAILPQDIGSMIWVGIVVVVLGISALVCLRLPDGNTAQLFAIAALGLCLISPRMVLYQWTIALPALAFVLSRIERPAAQLAFGAVALLPTLYVNRYLLDVNIDLPVDSLPLVIWSFSNYFVVLIAWIICLRVRSLV